MRSFEIHSAAVCTTLTGVTAQSEPCHLFHSQRFILKATTSFSALYLRSIFHVFIFCQRIRRCYTRGWRGRHSSLYFWVLAVCALCCGLFGGVKHTRRLKRQKKTKKLAWAGLMLTWQEHSQMDFSFLCCLVGHSQSVMSRSQAWSSDQCRCQSSQTAVITAFFLTCIQKNPYRIIKKLINI